MGYVFSAALLSLPQVLPLRIQNNCTQSVGRTGEDNFPQIFTPFFSFSLVMRAFQNFEFLLDVKESMLLCLSCVLTVVYAMFGVREIFKKIKEPGQEINLLGEKWQVQHC